MNAHLPGLDPRPGMRRVYCMCGCCWFYVPRSNHRPPVYATEECRRKAKRARDREAWPARREKHAAARATRRGRWIGEVLPKVLEDIGAKGGEG